MNIGSFPSRVQAAITPCLESTATFLKTQLSRVVDLAKRILSSLGNCLLSCTLLCLSHTVAPNQRNTLQNDINEIENLRNRTLREAEEHRLQYTQEIRQRQVQNKARVDGTFQPQIKECDDQLARLDAEIAECADTPEGQERRKRLEYGKKVQQAERKRLIKVEATVKRSFGIEDE